MKLESSYDKKIRKETLNYNQRLYNFYFNQA